MTVDTNKIVTVRNYALRIGKTPAYCYLLIKKGKLKCLSIDGVLFIHLPN